MHVVYYDSRYHTSNDRQLVFNLFPNDLLTTKSVPYVHGIDVVINEYTERTFVSLRTMQFLFLREETTNIAFLNFHPAGVQTNTKSLDAAIQLPRGCAYNMHIPLSETDVQCCRPDWTSMKMIPLRGVLGGDYLVLGFRRVVRNKIVKFAFSEREMPVYAKQGTIYPALYICTLPLPGMLILGRILTVVNLELRLFNMHLDVRGTNTLVMDDE